MKNIFKTLLISSALILSAGCVKETFPKGGTITKEQLEGSGNHLQYMLSGIPAAMMNPGTAGYASSFHGDFGIPAIHFATETMLEDLTFLGELGYSHFRYWHQNLGQGADYLYCTFFWKLYYKWIHLANEIIALVGNVDEATTDEERQALGQAYAYRAMFYLDLARMYESKPCSIQNPPESILGLTVPIVDEHTTEAQAQKNKRAKREDMYKFIISDLDKAEELLKGSSYVYTKPTTAAVYGLKARTYLELGASYAEFGDPKPEEWAEMTSQFAYEKAAEYARKTIDLDLHSPLTQAQWEDASTGFNDGTSNRAWIWGLTVSVENLSNLISNIAHRSPEALYGYAVWNQLGVNQALYNQISDEDFRKHSWYDPDLNYRYQLAGAAEVQGNYFVYNSTYAYPALKYLSLKFRPAEGNVMDYTIGNCADWCLMRIEEMYFIEMEAQSQLSGGLEKARTLLNDFIQTYRNPNYNCSLITENPQAFIKEMLLQKRIEFWGEGVLFFDYKRLNQGITRGYSGSNVPAVAQLNCEGRSPQWNIVITQIEYQSNRGIRHPEDNNLDPSEKITLWKE